MQSKKKKAAGYIRVSSKDQVEGESLSTQKASIKTYCKANDYKVTEIYADEGISGGSVKERYALLQCLKDGLNGKFDILVIHRLSRFGRNARELLNNHEELSKSNIQLRSISEGIDFSSKYGKAMLGMLAIIAELERDIIREQMLENRIARAEKGIPTSGKLPFGRTFNKKTNQWGLDEEVARLLRWSADEYLKGRSLRDISEILCKKHNQPLGHDYLRIVLSQRCGDKWTITFKNKKPISYDIPRILDDETIQRIKFRLQYNKVNNRKDVQRYVLTGFIRCEVCGKSLSGQTQRNKFGTVFKYYIHPAGKHEKCKAFNSIQLMKIEAAIFQTIFENILDFPAFERAIAESLPDEDLINDLEQQLKTNKKQLKLTIKELDKLVDIALAGTLEPETIKQKESALIQTKTMIQDEIEQIQDRLDFMPDSDAIKADAKKIQFELRQKYSGQDRLEEMTFDDKKALLHWLFDGQDQDGKPYGIYINKTGTHKDQKIDYFLYGRITGLRTLKGDDIDYQEWDEDDTENTNSKNQGSSKNQKLSKKKGSYKGSKLYKTISLASLDVDFKFCFFFPVMNHGKPGVSFYLMNNFFMKQFHQKICLLILERNPV